MAKVYKSALPSLFAELGLVYDEVAKTVTKSGETPYLLKFTKGGADMSKPALHKDSIKWLCDHSESFKSKYSGKSDTLSKMLKVDFWKKFTPAEMLQLAEALPKLAEEQQNAAEQAAEKQVQDLAKQFNWSQAKLKEIVGK